MIRGRVLNRRRLGLRDKEFRELKFTECMFCSEAVDKKHIKTCPLCRDSPMCEWCVEHKNCTCGDDDG